MPMPERLNSPGIVKLFLLEPPCGDIAKTRRRGAPHAYGYAALCMRGHLYTCVPIDLQPEIRHESKYTRWHPVGGQLAISIESHSFVSPLRSDDPIGRRSSMVIQSWATQGIH